MDNKDTTTPASTAPADDAEDASYSYVTYGMLQKNHEFVDWVRVDLEDEDKIRVQNAAGANHPSDHHGDAVFKDMDERAFERFRTQWEEIQASDLEDSGSGRSSGSGSLIFPERPSLFIKDSITLGKKRLTHVNSKKLSPDSISFGIFDADWNPVRLSPRYSNIDVAILLHAASEEGKKTSENNSNQKRTYLASEFDPQNNHSKDPSKDTTLVPLESGKFPTVPVRRTPHQQYLVKKSVELFFTKNNVQFFSTSPLRFSPRTIYRFDMVNGGIDKRFWQKKMNHKKLFAGLSSSKSTENLEETVSFEKPTTVSLPEGTEGGEETPSSFPASLPTGYVALTIDDAPCRFDDRSHSQMENVLDLLKKYNAKATFMAVSSFLADCHEPDMLRLLLEGHELANHGVKDEAMDKLSKEYFAKALDECNTKIMELQTKANEKRTSGDPEIEIGVKWFRPPQAKYTKVMEAELAQRDMHNVMCDAYAACPIVEDGPWIASALNKQIRNGSIAILHMPEKCGFRDYCLEALEQLLEDLQKRNFKVVTVGELHQIAEEKAKKVAAAAPEETGSKLSDFKTSLTTKVFETKENMTSNTADLRNTLATKVATSKDTFASKVSITKETMTNNTNELRNNLASKVNTTKESLRNLTHKNGSLLNNNDDDTVFSGTSTESKSDQYLFGWAGKSPKSSPTSAGESSSNKNSMSAKFNQMKLRMSSNTANMANSFASKVTTTKDSLLKVNTKKSADDSTGGEGQFLDADAGDLAETEAGNSHPSKLTEMKLRMASNTANMKSTFARNTANMKKDFASNTANMKKDFANNTANMKKDFANNTANMKKSFSNSTASMKFSLANSTAKFASNTASMKNSFASKVSFFGKKKKKNTRVSNSTPTAVESRDVVATTPGLTFTIDDVDDDL